MYAKDPEVVAQALSCAVAAELAALSEAWGLGAAGGAERVEEAVAASLQRIARRAERACVMKVLLPPRESRASALAPAPALAPAVPTRRRQKALEAELEAVDQRVASLAALAADGPGVGLRESASRWALEAAASATAAAKAQQTPSAGGASGACALAGSCLRQITLADHWLLHSMQKFEDSERSLRESLRGVASLAHVRGGVQAPPPNAQRALACLA